jgi:retron-type reverse transcriptase
MSINSKNRTFTVSVKKDSSTKINIQQGVPQGSCLSPTIFSIFISDIEEHLRKFFPDVKISLYADDICICTTNKDKKQIEKILQEVINEIVNFCNEWGLELNSRKCNYITFTTDHQSIKISIAKYQNFLLIKIRLNNKVNKRKNKVSTEFLDFY